MTGQSADVMTFDSDEHICRFNKAVVAYEYERGGATHSQKLATGGMAKISKTDSQGRTKIVYTFYATIYDASQYPRHELKTIEYFGRLPTSAEEFEVGGKLYSHALDGCNCALGRHVGIFFDEPSGRHLYNFLLDAGSNPDVVIPSEWKKSRTLTGVARRAITYMDGYVGTAQVKCGKANKKGLASVSVVITPINGKKKTYRSQKVDVTGSEVVVNWPGFKLELNGNSFSGSDGLCGGISIGSASVGGERYGTAYFDFGDVPETIDGRWIEYPRGVCEMITLCGRRWKLASATKMKWRECPSNALCGSGSWEVDMSGNRTNISGLKLSYSPKTGLFKGSFTLYTWSRGGKKYKANVTGLMVDGRGYGEAIVKRPYTAWAVSVD